MPKSSGTDAGKQNRGARCILSMCKRHVCTFICSSHIDNFHFDQPPFTHAKPGGFWIISSPWSTNGWFFFIWSKNQIYIPYACFIRCTWGRKWSVDRWSLAFLLPKISNLAHVRAHSAYFFSVWHILGMFLAYDIFKVGIFLDATFSGFISPSKRRNKVKLERNLYNAFKYARMVLKGSLALSGNFLWSQFLWKQLNRSFNVGIWWHRTHCCASITQPIHTYSQMEKTFYEEVIGSGFTHCWGSSKNVVQFENETVQFL